MTTGLEYGEAIGFLHFFGRGWWIVGLGEGMEEEGKEEVEDYG